MSGGRRLLGDRDAPTLPLSLPGGVEVAELVLDSEERVQKRVEPRLVVADHLVVALDPAELGRRLERVLVGAELIDQAQRLGLRAVPCPARGQALDLGALHLATLGDDVDELLVDLVDRALDERGLGGGECAERASGALVLARGDRHELDAELLEQPVDVGNLGDDADAAHRRAGQGDDRVGLRGDHVGAGGVRRLPPRQRPASSRPSRTSAISSLAATVPPGESTRRTIALTPESSSALIELVEELLRRDDAARRRAGPGDGAVDRDDRDAVAHDKTVGLAADEQPGRPGARADDRREAQA